MEPAPSCSNRTPPWAASACPSPGLCFLCALQKLGPPGLPATSQAVLGPAAAMPWPRAGCTPEWELGCLLGPTSQPLSPDFLSPDSLNKDHRCMAEGITCEDCDSRSKSRGRKHRNLHGELGQSSRQGCGWSLNQQSLCAAAGLAALGWGTRSQWAALHPAGPFHPCPPPGEGFLPAPRELVPYLEAIVMK